MKYVTEEFGEIKLIVTQNNLLTYQYFNILKSNASNFQLKALII